MTINLSTFLASAGGVLPVANGGTGVTSSTGTGSVVLSSGATMGAYTIGGTVTATGQEITSPVLNTAVAKGTWTASGTWTLPAHTLGGAITGNSQNVSGLGTLGCGAITSTGKLSINLGASNLMADFNSSNADAYIKLRNTSVAGIDWLIYTSGTGSGSPGTLRIWDNTNNANALTITGGASPSTSFTAINSTAIGATTPSTGAFTTLTTSGTATHATTISVGNATPSASGAGITFPATQNPSSNVNTLDDKDEYTAASANCTNALSTVAAVWSLVKVDKLVTLTLPDTFGTSSADTNFAYGTAIPAKYRPAVSKAFSVVVSDNNAGYAGQINISASTGVITVYRNIGGTGNWGTSANSGLASTTLSWTAAN